MYKQQAEASKDLVRCEDDDETDDDGGEKEHADGEEHLTTAKLNDRSSDGRRPRSVVDVIVDVVHAVHHHHLRLHARRGVALPTLTALLSRDLSPASSCCRIVILLLQPGSLLDRWCKSFSRTILALNART